MDNIFKIVRIPLPRLMSLSLGGKQRNKELLAKLAAFNRDLTHPAIIVSALGLTGDDLDFLDQLGSRPDGWQLFDFSGEGLARDNVERLTLLGLIRLRWRSKTIALTDAGRFLLVLADSEPLEKLG